MWLKSQLHDGKFWLVDNVVEISANLIHEVTALCNEGSIPVNEKNVKKLVLDNTKSFYNGRGIVISKIKLDDVKFLSGIIAARMCYSSKEDDMAAGFIQVAYKICVDREKVNLCEILRAHLTKNLEKIKKVKNSQFRFQSVITHVFPTDQEISVNASINHNEQ